jgi:hypothetical protein
MDGAYLFLLKFKHGRQRRRREEGDNTALLFLALGVGIGHICTWDLYLAGDFFFTATEIGKQSNQK